MNGGYWEVDGIENAINYLEMIDHFLTGVNSDWKWKWVIISTHQALYSFGLCALTGTSGWHTLTDRGKDHKKRTEGQMIAQARALDVEGDTPKQIAKKLGVDKEKALQLLKQQPRIIGIGEVLKRLKKKQNLPWSNSRPLQMRPEEKRAIEGLIRNFRNEFEHYYPEKHWDIDPQLVAGMVNYCTPVIKFIALESNCIIYRHEKPRVEAAFERIHGALQKALA